MTPLCKMVHRAWWGSLLLLTAAGFGNVEGAPPPPVVTSINANGLGTVVTATGSVSNITGGTLAGGNLFHSFSTFNLGGGDTANFNVSSGVANILARVTGGASTIDGTITSTINGGATLSNANLFFINPAGVMFTSNAQVNLGGSFTATTASYVGFNGSPNLFYGDTTHTTADNKLSVTTAPVASFGFLPGATYSPISIESGATFNATGMQFVGGDFTTGAGVSLTTSNSSSVIGIFSAASGDPLNDAIVPYITSPTGDYSGATNFKTYGTVTLGDATAGGSTISATGSGGSVVIRGGHLIQQGAGSLISASRKVSIRGTKLDVLTGGTISTTTGTIGIDTDGDVTLTGGTITSAGGSITLGQLSMVNLTLDSASSITETAGAGGNLTLNSTGTISNSGTISTASSGQSLQISANSLSLSGGTISTSTAPITIDTIADVTMTNMGTITSAGGSIALGQSSMASLSLDSTSGITETAGTTGTLNINTTGTISNSGTISTQGSNLTINTTGDLNLTGGTISSQGGTIRLGTSHLNNLSLDSSSTINAAAGGDVFVTASGDIVLTGGIIESTSTNNTHAGLVNVTATSGNITLSSNGQIASVASGNGNAGSVTVTDNSGTIALSSGAQIASITNSSGDAGSVIVNASVGQTTAANALTVDGSSSGIFSLSNGTGDAVNVSVTATGEIVLSNGGQIASMVGSSGSGNAGSVTVNANIGQANDPQALTLTGTGLSSINTGIFALNNGTGSSTGNAGNVTVNAVGNVTLSLGGQIASVVNNVAGGTAGSVTLNLNQVIGSTLTIGGPTAETPGVSVTPFPIIYSLTQNPGKTDGNVAINALLSFVTLQSGAVIQTSSQDTTAGNVSVQASSLTLDADTAIQSLMSQANSDTAVTGFTGNVSIYVLNPFSFDFSTFSFSGPLSIDATALIQTIAKPTLKTYDPLGTVSVRAGSLTEGGTAAVADLLGNFTQVDPSNLEIRRFNTTTFGLPNANDPSTDSGNSSTELTIQNLGGIPFFDISALLGNLFGNFNPPPPAAGNGLVLDGSLGGTFGEHISPTLINNTFYQYDITPADGTRAGGNLFFSFLEFDLGFAHPDPVSHPNLTSPVAETALFDLTGYSTPIQNILVRVTGGPSTINGTLAEAGTTANIFFLDSAGVMFGGNSSLNLSGAFTVSTANDVVFNTGGTFTTSLPNTTDPALTSNPNSFIGTVADYGFAPNSVPQGVIFQGARLSDAVQNGSPASQIQVIAGDISLQGTTLLNATQTLLFSTASSGTLHFLNGNSLASFPSSSTTNPTPFTSTSQVFDDSSFGTLGTVNLTGPAVISVPTPNFASTIAIRAANFNLLDGQIVDQTTADSGSRGGTVLIDVTGNVTITSQNNSSFISTSTLGDSEGGSIQINAQNLTITSNAQNIYTTGIFSTAEPARYFSSDTGYTNYKDYGTPGTASGNAGSITLDISNTLTVSTFGQISTNTNGLGNAGTITIQGPPSTQAQPNPPSPQVILNSGGSITSSTSLDNPAFVRTGAAGTVNIHASSLNVTGILLGDPSLIATSAGTAANPSGPTGDGGTISIIVSGQFGPGNGDITISDGGQISASSFNNGRGGTVSITQSHSVDGLTIDGGGLTSSTGIFAAEFSTGSSLGTTSNPAIKITTDAPVLLEAGGEITTSAADTGNAGPISISSGNLTIDGTGAATSVVTGILSDSAGTAATPLTATGNGGDIGLTVTGDLRILNNGAVSASSETVGNAGTVTITQNGSADLADPATNPATNGGLDISSGGSISTAANGPGSTPPTHPPPGGGPGQITLNIQALTLNNGSVTSSTSGASNGGGITINGATSPDLAQFVVVQNGGTISSNTASTGSGGTIMINSGSVNVTGASSAISTSATAGTGSGGNIDLAVTGKANTLGSTGDVTVTNAGTISASSSTVGQAGTVTITQSNSLDLTDPSLDPATNGGLFLGSGGLITTAANGAGSSTLHPGAGDLTLHVEALTVTGNSQILSSTKGASKAGDVKIDGSLANQNSQFIVVNGGAKIASETGGTGGSGAGGTITIGTESLLVDGAEISTSSTGGIGNAGDISITAASNVPGPTAWVTVQNSGNIISSSSTQGSAGMISIQANQTIVTGMGTTISTDAGQFGRTNNSKGEITLAGQNLTVTDSGLVSATTGGLSPGGTITIQDSNQVTVTANGKIDASSTAPTGGGNGGSVLIGSDPLTAPEDYGSNSPFTVSLFQGGVISADSQNTNGGNIAIHTNDLSLINGSLISTSEPNGAADTLGGDITIRAGHTLYLNNFSFINSNAGQGTGGNIVIDPQFAILNHSGISAAGGLSNGNVTIDATFVLSGTSFIIATGTVSIDSVPLDLAGSLIALPANLTSEERRLREKCARAINHEFSSLIVVGRGGTESAPEELQPDFGIGDLPQSSSQTP